MAISLDDINRLTLRAVFLPWFRQMCVDQEITIPADWNPSDEELSQLATRMAEGLCRPDQEEE